MEYGIWNTQDGIWNTEYVILHMCYLRLRRAYQFMFIIYITIKKITCKSACICVICVLFIGTKDGTYKTIKPYLAPRLTASVRLLAPSLLKMEEMWNLTVWVLMRSSRAMSLLGSP